MRYRTTPAFEGDWRRLSEDERRRFREVVRERFHPACQRRIADPASPWPRALRVRDVEGAHGILEMTWSYSGPDGRATFDWLVEGGEPIIRWRRIGGHAIFGQP